MPEPAKPATAFLTADSRPLFWRRGGVYPLWEAVRAARGGGSATRGGGDAAAGGGLRAVYLGASNGDDPRYYAVFAAAMELAGIADHTHVTARFRRGERAALEAADVVVLAGGDAELGWRAFERSGILEVLAQRRAAGAVLIGVSAGAAQLGGGGLGALPHWVDVHDEAAGWQRLRQRVRSAAPPRPGLGIPFGGGVAASAGGEPRSLRIAAVLFTPRGRAEPAMRALALDARWPQAAEPDRTGRG
jgi:hypothetical protein